MNFIDRTPQQCGGSARCTDTLPTPEGARAAAALTAANACALLDALPIGIFLSERSGRVHYANAAMRDMLEIPNEAGLADISAATGRTLDPADRERFWNQLETDGEVRGFETTATCFNGRHIEVVLNAHLRPGNPPCCEGSVEDITARKAAERAVDDLNRMLMEATREAGMAEAARSVIHKAGNVLTSINLTVDDLRDSVRESGVLNLCLLADCVDRERGWLGAFIANDPVGRQLPDLLLRISNQLKKEHSRLEEGLENLDRHCRDIRESIVGESTDAEELENLEILELQPLVSIVLRLENEECRRNGITLESRVPPAVRLLGDRLRVAQALILLVQHYCCSVAAIDDGPRSAVVTASAEGSWLAVTVAATADTAPVEERRKIEPGDGENCRRLQRCLLAARAAGATLYAHNSAGFTLHIPSGKSFGTHP